MTGPALAVATRVPDRTSTRPTVGRAPPRFLQRAAPAEDRPLHGLEDRCPCGGGCPVCESSPGEPALLQPKLLVSQPADPFEREAERFADILMAGPAGEPRTPPLARSPTLGIAPLGTVQTCPGDCDCSLEERAAWLRRSRLHEVASGRGPPAVPPAVHDAVRSPGRPLDPEVRSLFEARLGHNLSRVRVHDDSPAAESARAVNARAYTLGSHIVFAPGQYAPNTGRGIHLLAHELVHTVQQRGVGTGTARSARRVQCVPSDATLTDAGLTLPLAHNPVLHEILAGRQLLSVGDRGPAVRLLQQALVALGFPLPSGVDGIFGLETEAAVKGFQQGSRLSGADVDGVVGPTTLSLIDVRLSDTPGALIVPQLPEPGVTDISVAPTEPTAAPGPSVHDVIDPRIDVAAQRAILRMRSRSPDRASELLGFIKKGDLRGFVGDDLQLSAQHASELGTVRWELVPPGEDAAVVPGAPGSAPLAVYREAARDDRTRMDAVADLVHDEAQEFQKGPPTRPGAPIQRIIIAGGYPEFKTPAEEMASIQSKQWLPNTLDFHETALDTQGANILSASDDAAFFGAIAFGPEKLRRIVYIGHGFGGVLSGGLGLSAATPSSAFPTQELNESSFPKRQADIDINIKPKLDKDAFIDLYACNLAGMSTNFMKAMARSFGVCVRGFKDFVVWCIDPLPKGQFLRGRLNDRPRAPSTAVLCTDPGWFKGVNNPNFEPPVKVCP